MFGHQYVAPGDANMMLSSPYVQMYPPVPPSVQSSPQMVYCPYPYQYYVPVMINYPQEPGIGGGPVVNNMVGNNNWQVEQPYYFSAPFTTGSPVMPPALLDQYNVFLDNNNNYLKYIVFDGETFFYDGRGAQEDYNMMPHSSTYETDGPFEDPIEIRNKNRRKRRPKARSSNGHQDQPQQRQLFCKLCKSNGESPNIYSSHILKNEKDETVCPILQKLVCEICGKTGTEAHTRKYCPTIQPLDFHYRKVYNSAGRLRTLKY